MKKKWIVIGAIVVLVILGIFGFINNSNKDEAKSEEAQTQEYQVVLKDITQSYSTSGNVYSKVDKIIRAPFDSEKFTLSVAIGDEVKKGDPIGVFDDSDIRISLLTQEKTVANIEYQLAQLNNEGNKSQLSNLENSRSAYESAKETYDKNLSLYNAGAVSLSELNSSKDAMNNAYNNYESNRGIYYGFDLENEVEILEKTLEVEQIRLDQLEEDYQMVELFAENDGTIVDLFIDSGDSVVMNQEIYQMMDLNQLEVITEISEYEIKDIQLGQEVIVTTLGDDSVSARGVIKTIYPKANVSTSDVTITVKIDLIKPKSGLIPGFSTNLEIIIANKESAKVVPYDALVETPKGYMITKLIDGEEEMVSVDTGVESDLMIEIISDQIQENDTIIVYSSIDFSDKGTGNGMFIPGQGKNRK